MENSLVTRRSAVFSSRTDKVFKNLIKDEKKKKRSIPDKPKVPIPQRKDMAILGIKTKQRGKLDNNTIEADDEFALKSRNEWKKRDEEGFSSVHSKRQKKDAPAVDETLSHKRIEVLISFDINNEGTETAPR